MSPADRIRWLLAPDKSRWKPMLMGLALFASGAGTAVLLQSSEIIAAGLLILSVAAWFVGACAMVGYVRWFFASELQQMRQDRDDAAHKDDTR